MHKSRLAKAAALIVLTVSPYARVAAQQGQVQPEPTWSQQDMMRIVTEVQHQLRGLTNFSVFDWITFGIHGKTLVLKGYASRPTLKDDAARAVKNIQGIDKVENEIVVLPLSSFDDGIRAQVYNRIYTQGALRKTSEQRLHRTRHDAGMNIGGITQNPPMGYHAIHIIVNNGYVTLFGVVLNQRDASIAYIQANGTPGVFSVDNDIVVQGSKPNQAPR